MKTTCVLVLIVVFWFWTAECAFDNGEHPIARIVADRVSEVVATVAVLVLLDETVRKPRDHQK